MSNIKDANIFILNQLKCVLEQFDKKDYQKPLPILNGVSIGQHSRHIIEFYQCLFEGLVSLKINYDARQRDLRIETDLSYAIVLIDDFITKIKKSNFTEAIVLEVAFDNLKPIEVVSSTDRELSYLIEHTIHHLAILNIAINAVFKEIRLPDNFGVAFSTIFYQSNRTLTA